MPILHIIYVLTLGLTIGYQAQCGNFVWKPAIQNVMKTFFEENPDATFVEWDVTYVYVRYSLASSIKPNIKVLSVEPFVKKLICVHKATYLNNNQDCITLSCFRLKIIHYRLKTIHSLILSLFILCCNGHPFQ